MPAVSQSQQRFMGMVQSPSVIRTAEKMAADFEAADPGNLAIRYDGTGEDDPSVAMSWDDVMSNDISNHIADPIERRNFIASLMGLPIDEPQAQLPAQMLARAAKSMSAEDAHDFAATKHKGLPEKVGFAEKMAADAETPKSKQKLGPLQHSYVADALGGTAIENTGRLLRQQEIGDHGIYDRMLMASGPLAEALGTRIRRANSRLATSKGTRLLALLDPTATRGPGLVELSTGVGKKIPEKEEETRQMYAEHIKPYQDKVTEGSTTSRETPWYMSTAGNLANLDSDIAGHSYLRNEQPGHYWLNPFIKAGPLYELNQRALRRHLAGSALPESTRGRFLSSVAPFYSIYAGGEEAQNRLRRSAMKNNIYDQVAVPEKAPAEKAAYVKLNPSSRVASRSTTKPFQVPPSIGQSKAGPVVPPATADAKMVMRAAPSVPNPIVPSSQSGTPMTATKTSVAKTPLAPRYTASAKKGKKVMPQPYARQCKSAADIGQMMAGGLNDATPDTGGQQPGEPQLGPQQPGASAGIMQLLAAIKAHQSGSQGAPLGGDMMGQQLPNHAAQQQQSDVTAAQMAAP